MPPWHLLLKYHRIRILFNFFLVFSLMQITIVIANAAFLSCQSHISESCQMTIINTARLCRNQSKHEWNKVLPIILHRKKVGG